MPSSEPRKWMLQLKMTTSRGKERAKTIIQEFPSGIEQKIFLCNKTTHKPTQLYFYTIQVMTQPATMIFFYISWKYEKMIPRQFYHRLMPSSELRKWMLQLKMTTSRGKERAKTIIQEFPSGIEKKYFYVIKQPTNQPNYIFTSHRWWPNLSQWYFLIFSENWIKGNFTTGWCLPLNRGNECFS